MVDLERRRVVDLLPDRTAETLADWLRGQPQIAVVARDRSTEYARGILMGAPAAMQVADRWHVLVNMRQAVERWLAGARGAAARVDGLPADRAGAARAAGAQPPGGQGRARAGKGGQGRARALLTLPS